MGALICRNRKAPRPGTRQTKDMNVPSITYYLTTVVPYYVYGTVHHIRMMVTFFDDLFSFHRFRVALDASWHWRLLAAIRGAVAVLWYGIFYRTFPREEFTLNISTGTS